MTFEASAEVYDRHVGRYGNALAAALIRFADVRRDDRVLDVGCGPGALTAALAEHVGATNVTAVDPSESFVAACRERVPRATVVRAAAEALPVQNGAFDAVLSQLVVNFLADPDGGVGEMRRAARGGGTVAGCVGVRRRDDDAPGLLGRGARARSGGAGRGTHDAVLHAR
jgi:ubiquinone/menaquinone biosynthesis C-methylase UbiE